MRVILSDTSPIRYLIMIGESEVLRLLYGRLLIPESVAQELDQPRTPIVVRQWISQPPPWLQVLRPSNTIDSRIHVDLDRGERDAILLALEVQADLLLMDDREGVEEAIRLGLAVTGTLGVLDRAPKKGCSLSRMRFDACELRTSASRLSCWIGC